METEEILIMANEIAARYGLKVEISEDVMSVGVQGDNRTYTRIIILIGKFPGYEALEAISTEITNTLEINRVLFETVRK